MFFTWSHPESLKVSHLCLEGSSFWTNLNKARLIFFLMDMESFVKNTITHFHFYIFSKDDSLGLNRNSPFAETIVQQKCVELGEDLVAGIASHICISAFESCICIIAVKES